MIMAFKIGRMFFIWRKRQELHSGDSTKHRARLWVGEAAQIRDKDGRGNCAEEHDLTSPNWRKLKKVLEQNITYR